MENVIAGASSWFSRTVGLWLNDIARDLDLCYSEDCHDRYIQSTYGYEVITYDDTTGFPDKTRDVGPRPMMPKWAYALILFLPSRLLYEIKMPFLILYCYWFGHDWVDSGYGGPESGVQQGHCSRCYFGFRHVLY